MKSLDEVVCFVGVQAPGFAPQRLDGFQWDALVLWEARQFAEPVKLVFI